MKCNSYAEFLCVYPKYAAIPGMTPGLLHAIYLAYKAGADDEAIDRLNRQAMADEWADAGNA